MALTVMASIFADDATCTLKDVTSVVGLFELCEQYSKYSGLCLNVSKSLLVYIGSCKVKPNIPKYEVQIEKDFFNILGIFLGQDRTKCNEINFNHNIHKDEARTKYVVAERLFSYRKGFNM